jgi:ketosteroid isomerase-like protein
MPLLEMLLCGVEDEYDANLRCKAVKVVRPLGPLDSVGRALLTNAIREFRPVGATPIATALAAAGSELAKGRGPAGLVLISDGKETCGGDPSAETARLVKELKLTFGVNVIGFDVQPDERAALEEIARVGKGQYYNAESAAKFRTVVQAMRKTIAVAARPAVKKDVAAAKPANPEPKAQSREETEREIIRLEHGLADAIAHNDTVALDSLLPDDYIVVQVNGGTRAKGQYIADMKAGDLRYDLYGLENLKVRLYGDTAIVTGHAHAKGRDMQQGVFEWRSHYMRVYVKREGHWQPVITQWGT